MTVISRRAALALLVAALPSGALAAKRHERNAPPGGVLVDVSPLRRSGDNTDADFLADALPGYLQKYLGPGRSVRARVESVTYGSPGSNGTSNNNGAVDTIEGVGWVDGHEIPITSSIQTTVSFRRRRLRRADTPGSAGAKLRAMAGAAIGRLALTLRALVIGSGRIGNEINALGVVEALGGAYELRRVAPRYLYSRLAPWGPVDPLDLDILRGPPPDLVISSGRMTVPYMRAWKRAHPQVFAAFMQDPRWGRSEFDLIWAPEHDGLRGGNVFSTLTSPHPFSPARLAAARAAPDPRVARRPGRAAPLRSGARAARSISPTTTWRGSPRRCAPSARRALR